MAPHRKAFPTDAHGWAELLPPRKPAPAWQGERHVKWAVIGAGFTGLACAARLGELHPGDEIVLLEARQIGQGASGRNSGFAVAVSHFGGSPEEGKRGEYERVNRINRAGLARLATLVERHAIDCQWSAKGFFHTAADDKAITEAGHFRAYLEALEIPHAVHDREAAAALLGTAHYHTAIHVREGALVQPAALVRGLAAHLPANVKLFEASPVHSISAGSPVVLELATGRIRADHVLIATNHEAPRLGFLKRHIAASTLAGSFTRILTAEERAALGSLGEWGVLSLHSGGATVRLTRDGRISLRNTAEYHGGRLLDEGELATRQRIHRKAFERRFPQLSHVRFEFAWSGVEGISRNQTNFFAQPAASIRLAGGYNGSGVSRGTAFGMALAEWASGGQSQLISDCLASKPASWIPPSPLLDIGAAWTVASRFRGVGDDR